jgi:hypothetical protein
MSRVRAARRAELLDDELLSLLLFVLAGRVITPFTAIARQTYQISHRSYCLSIIGRVLSATARIIENRVLSG